MKFLKRALCIFGFLVLAGCSPQTDTKLSCTTGKSYNYATVVVAVTALGSNTIPSFPDSGYSEVNSAWLKEFYQDFKKDLFAKDVVGWENRFDCNKFAAAFSSQAQMRFYKEMFHSWNPAQALAIGDVWYVTRGGGGHAINIALTERGIVFFEPQTGNEVTLTVAEKKSIYAFRF